jgi:hypothetical protein
MQYSRWVNLLLAAGAAVCGVSAAAALDRDAGWVEQRIREWQPTEKERSLERIGWAKELRTALRLGAERARPVFLFTLDGRMGVGRC